MRRKVARERAIIARCLVMRSNFIMIQKRLCAAARLCLPFLLSVIFFTSCASFSASNFDDKGRGERYQLKGKIVAVDKTKREVTVEHQAIDDYMDAMTMPFKVKDADALNEMSAGDDLQATLVVFDGRTWLENPIITKGDSIVSNYAVASSHAAEPHPGALVPDFTLRNQDDKLIRFDQYRGRALLLTFIYTRCPLPDYCPLLTANFAAIEQDLKKDPQLYNQTHLLSITIDPDYDTPQVLRDYARARAGLNDFAHWEFATSEPSQIQRVAQFFGLNYFRENGQIIHALRTVVIAPDGRIYKIYADNLWKPADALRDVRAVLK
jgi:protein SCO1/2